jgi:hypothetical protein
MTYEYSCPKFVLTVLAVQSLTNHNSRQSHKLSPLALDLDIHSLAHHLCKM